MKAPKKALLEKINVEDINILVPTLVKMFKLKSSKDKILKTKDIVTFFNNKKIELGLKTSFNTQRLQKLINYIRVKDRKSTRLNSSHVSESRMTSSA